MAILRQYIKKNRRNLTASLNYSSLNYSSLNYSALNYSVLNYSALNYSTSNYSTLNYSGNIIPVPVDPIRDRRGIEVHSLPRVICMVCACQQRSNSSWKTQRVWHSSVNQPQSVVYQSAESARRRIQWNLRESSLRKIWEKRVYCPQLNHQTIQICLGIGFRLGWLRISFIFTIRRNFFHNYLYNDVF